MTDGIKFKLLGYFRSLTHRVFPSFEFQVGVYLREGVDSTVSKVYRKGWGSNS